MKTESPAHGSGKTYFNRIKAKGQSWVKLRDDARRQGTWRPHIKARHDHDYE